MSAGSTQPISIPTTVSPSSSAEFSSYGSPQSFPPDFLSFPTSPYSFAQSPPGRGPSTELLRDRVRPVGELDLHIEPMSAVAIFALLRLYPADSQIGMNKEGDFEILSATTYVEYITRGVYRYMTNQNGDQLGDYIEPIKKACLSYDHTNKDLGIIFLFAYLGAEGLKRRYEEKKTVKVKLNQITDIFLQQIIKCHQAHNFPPLLAQQIPALIYATPPPAALPQQSPPSLRLMPQPSIPSERVYWTAHDLDEFATTMTFLWSQQSREVPIDEKRSYLLKRVQAICDTYRNSRIYGRHG